MENPPFCYFLGTSTFNLPSTIYYLTGFSGAVPVFCRYVVYQIATSHVNNKKVKVFSYQLLYV